MSLNHTLFVALLSLFSLPCVAQTPEDDVVLLKDGTMFRGALRDEITPGHPVILHRADGKKSVLYWSEILNARRLPREIPDSLIRQSLSEPQDPSPRIDLRGYEGFEDVLFLKDSSLVRGVQLNYGINGQVGIWADGHALELPRTSVHKWANVPRGLPDSTLVDSYFVIPKAFDEDRSYFISVFGGIAIPTAGAGRANVQGTRSFATGVTGGIEIGIPLGSGVRWISSASYSTHTRGTNPVAGSIDGIQGTETKGKLLILLTGAEFPFVRISKVTFHGIAQAGLLSLRESGYEIPIPQTFFHLSRTLKVGDISSSSLALCAGVGAQLDRTGFDVRWIIARPQYVTKTEIIYPFGYGGTVEATEDSIVQTILMGVRMSIF